jgi:hypothetical protein
MNEPCLKLEGLDASNPLAYLAALGLLQVLTDVGAAAAPRREWRLSWRDEGRWLAVLHGSDDLELVIQHLQADVASWRDELALQLAYDAEGKRLSPSSNEATFDLKPSPDTFRAFADEAANNCTPNEMRSVRLIAAYGSELVTANKGDLKPTALHFTSANQKFLWMVRALQQGLTGDDFNEALFGPWRNESNLPNLSWNASAPRIYAYRANNPAPEKRGSVPAADWLAFVGLRFFPVTSKGSRLLTTGVEGSWKDSTMRWPVWTSPLSVNAIRSLQTWKGLRDPTARERWSAAGISGLFGSRILRSEQGGYGSFSPASVL